MALPGNIASDFIRLRSDVIGIAGHPAHCVILPGIFTELTFARDNSSYREQKPSIRPLYHTLQPTQFQHQPLLLVSPSLAPSRRGSLWGTSDFGEAPAGARDPHHRLAIRIPTGVAPVARITLSESAPAVRCGPVEAGNLSSAITPPSPCQIGRFEKKRGSAGPGSPSGAIAPPSPCQIGGLGKKRERPVIPPSAEDAGSPAVIRTR